MAEVLALLCLVAFYQSSDAHLVIITKCLSPLVGTLFILYLIDIRTWLYLKRVVRYVK